MSIIAPILALVGLFLSVAGLFSRNKNKLFPILGISFWISMVSILLVASSDYDVFPLVAGGIIAPILALVGLILGVVGLFTRNKNKLFPILGILVNLGVISLCFWVMSQVKFY